MFIHFEPQTHNFGKNLGAQLEYYTSMISAVKNLQLSVGILSIRKLPPVITTSVL